MKKIDIEMSWDFIIAGTVLFKQYFISMTIKDGKSIDIADQNTFNTIQFLKTVNNIDYAYIEILGVGDFFGGKINYRVAGPQDIDVMIINPSLASVSSDDEFDTWSIKNFMNIVEHRANYTYSTRSALRFFAMFKDKHNSTQIEDITTNARYLNTLSNIGVTNDVIEKLLGDNNWIDKNSNETKSSVSGQEPSSVGDNETLINKTKIQCFACGAEWEFDDSKIPTGERYEVTCPKCQMKLRRKKV